MCWIKKQPNVIQM